jgi:glycosyltransferase involved in cell wall biosynthesis
MGNDPEIAVVIGAYRRETYLRDAVRSVLAQKLDRDRYEVVVVKGFEDLETDRFLAENGIAVRTDHDVRIGEWLLRAVAMTHAPLLAFLDDDDEFEPDRLERAIAVFREHPEVGFYRNRVRVIDSTGAAVPEERWRPIDLDAPFDRTGPVLLPPRDAPSTVEVAFRRTHASFNSSTMVVRRELLSGANGERFAELRLPDLTLLVLSTVSSWGLYLDDRRLTRYRVHGGNVTGRVDWLRRASHDHRDLAGLARDAKCTALAEWLDLRADHYERMYRGGRVVEAVAAREDRRAVAALSVDYLRYLGQHPAERAPTLDVWASAAYGFGYLLAPGLARHVLAARPTSGPN